MNFLTHFLLILSSASINNSERWYSAAIIETDQPYKSEEQKEFQGIPGTEENVLKIDERLASYGYSTEDASRWRFMKPKSNNDLKIFHETKGPPENNVSNNKMKPKIRKRCPEACSRKSLRSNQTKLRFLEVFQVVEFDNAACMSSSGLEGTCLHEYECQSTGGTGMGSCADGYGICCVSK